MQGYEFQKMVLLVVVWLIQFYVILLSFIKVFYCYNSYLESFQDTS